MIYFFIYMALEIWLATLTIEAIGWLRYFLVLVIGFYLGLVLLRWMLRKMANAGAMPNSGLAQAGLAMNILAALLLMVPGLSTDVVALTLILPPFRQFWQLWMSHKILKTFQAAQDSGRFAFFYSSGSRTSGSTTRTADQFAARDVTPTAIPGVIDIAATRIDDSRSD